MNRTKRFFNVTIRGCHYRFLMSTLVALILCNEFLIFSQNRIMFLKSLHFWNLRILSILTMPDYLIIRNKLIET
ncbi:MAG: hypothetical protein IJG38_15310 [Thermoguttaceae bacterium]|nr:hypothetical protein [Thermoguttaceae bacterium]MBQ6617647.1 hypothetical protein [Thermoguttaceae bacterium]